MEGVKNYFKEKLGIVSLIKPPSRKTPLDELSSFALFGLDVKITPKEEVKLIEVNGTNSGMEGFKQAKVKLQRTFTDENLLINYLRNFRSNPCQNALEQHLNSYGKKQIAFIGHVLFRKGHLSDRFLRNYFSDMSEAINKEWEKVYGTIAERLAIIETILDSKLATDMFFTNLRRYKTKSYKCCKEGLENLLKEENPEFVVVKPDHSSQGRRVSIIKTEELKTWTRISYDSSFILEAFIPSKSLPSKETKKFHDGCMRYVVLVEEDKNGNLKINHFGGYWRLCPQQIEEYGKHYAMAANFCNGAIAERASKKDLILVKNEVEKFLPVFYRELIVEENNLKGEQYVDWLNSFLT